MHQEEGGAKTDFKPGQADPVWQPRGAGETEKTDIRLVQTVEVCFRLKVLRKYKSLKYTYMQLCLVDMKPSGQLRTY